jgi:hypothetical protein
MKWCLGLVVLFLTACGGASDPHEMLVPQNPNTWNENAEFMGAVEKLPAEEREIVLDFGTRALKGSSAIPLGFKIKDLLAMVRAGLGPECKKFIAEFEKTCAAPDAPAMLCTPVTKSSIEEAKKGFSTPENEKSCKQGLEAFARASEMLKPPVWGAPTTTPTSK